MQIDLTKEELELLWWTCGKGIDWYTKALRDPGPNVPPTDMLRRSIEKRKLLELYDKLGREL